MLLYYYYTLYNSEYTSIVTSILLTDSVYCGIILLDD